MACATITGIGTFADHPKADKKAAGTWFGVVGVFAVIALVWIIQPGKKAGLTPAEERELQAIDAELARRGYDVSKLPK